MPITVLMCWKDFSPECGVLCALSKRCQKSCIYHTNHNQNVSLRFLFWMCCGGIFKWFLKLSAFIGVKSHRLHLFGFSPLWAFKCGLKLPAWINTKSHWLHLFDLSPLCAFKCLLKSPEFIMVAFGFSPLCVFKCVLTTVRIFWPSRAVAEGPHGP